MLKINNLSYSLGRKTLLSNFSACFLPGKIYGILGPNGSGKTTLLKCLTGIWNPTQGTVTWNDENLLNQPRTTISKIITYVPQNPPIPFDFTVMQFVNMGLYPHRAMLDQSQSIDRVEKALEAVDAIKYRHYSINRLSQGERQRIFIARALATKAEILAFDEPTANLDLKYQKIIWNLLKALKEQKKTIIITTHDLHKSKCFCDQVFILNLGSCVAAGSYTKAMSPCILRQVFDADPEAMTSSQDI